MSEVRVADDLDFPGLSFRRFRGESDYPVMVDIMASCNRVDGLEYNESVEDVARVFAHLTNCDPQEDVLFAEVHGEPAGYARVFFKDEWSGPRLYVSLGFVVPAFRRRGLGTVVLRWSEERRREIAGGHPAELEKVGHVWTTDGEPGAMALYTDFGYRVARELVEMIRPIGGPLAEAPLSEGLEIRAVAPVHYRPVWDAWEEAYRDHWGYTPRSDVDYERWLGSRLFQPGLWKVAFDGDLVAGMVLNYVDERRNEWAGTRRGYTQNVFVLRPWRRRGLARSLLTESIRMFSDMGMEETLLAVDAESPSGADSLYESLGYRPTRRHLVYRRPLA
ncbi:MAG: GNAT family N-acetyltransferase [Planctomycetota bacterium]|jgi:GNAT superfamily N-acetyltransferase